MSWAAEPVLDVPGMIEFGLEGGPVDGRGQARRAGGTGRRPAGVC
jgi:hypothetical protein